MPSRNVLREFAPGHYYHVYNRGVAKMPIFIDHTDKQKFLSIIARHLDPGNTEKRGDGMSYRKFDKDVELLCYCLMNNHFHMLLYLEGKDDSLSEFIRSVCTAYSMYFNKRHKRAGTLFQGVFRASRISNDSYLQHITRYIHLNPKSYKTYRYSSLPQYLGKPSPSWLKPKRALKIFSDTNYSEFLEDYEGQKAILDEFKYNLADI